MPIRNWVETHIDRQVFAHRLIEASLKYDPFSRNLFCFTNKRRNQIKVLYWERSGFCLWLKRLEEERFKWPTHMRHVAEGQLTDRRSRG